MMRQEQFRQQCLAMQASAASLAGYTAGTFTTIQLVAGYANHMYPAYVPYPAYTTYPAYAADPAYAPAGPGHAQR